MYGDTNMPTKPTKTRKTTERPVAATARRAVARAQPVIPAVSKDDNVKLIYGVITHLEHDSEAGEGEMTVRDVDGKKHDIALAGNTAIRHGLIQWLGAKNDRLTAALEGDIDLAKATHGRPRLFRVRDNGTLYGITGSRYRPVTAREIAARIRHSDVASGAKVTFKDGDGLHGGYVQVNYGKSANGIADMSLFIDAGAKNGREAANVLIGGLILACSNQLTLESTELAKLQLGKDGPGNLLTASRNRHTISPIERLLDDAAGAAGKLKAISEVFAHAREVKLSAKDAASILRFYRAKNYISRKVQDVILGKLDDRKVAQHPGTFYGLAMVLTYVGTHSPKNEVSEGVAGKLKQLGGEVLMATTVRKAYMEMVEANQPKDDEKAVTKTTRPAARAKATRKASKVTKASRKGTKVKSRKQVNALLAVAVAG